MELPTSLGPMSRPRAGPGILARLLISTYVTVSLRYHEARVYALHDSGAGARKSLQLVGEPILFFVDDKGTMTRLPSKVKCHDWSYPRQKIRL